MRTPPSDRAPDSVFRRLVESSRDGFCIVRVLFDDAGRPNDYLFLEANASFEEHTGLRDVVGKRVRELVPDLDEVWFKLYGGVAMTGEPVRVENAARAMNRWFEVFADRIGPAEERQVAVVFKDITRRKEAELLLKESEARARDAAERAEHERRLLDAILDAAPVGIVVADADGAVVRMNAASERLLGKQRQPQGEPHHLGWRGWHLDSSGGPGAPIPDDGWPLARALRGETTASEIAEVEPLNGTGRRTILSSGAPVRDAQGKIVGAIAAQMDVTDRAAVDRALREAQRRAAAAEAELLRATEVERQRLYSSFMQAPVAIAIVRGPQHIVDLANPLVCRLWHRTRDQVLGKPVFEAIPEAAEQGFDKLLESVRTSGVPFIGTEIPVRFARTDGGPIEDTFLNFVYEPLRDGSGAVEGIIAVAVDVTDAVKARRRAEVLREQAEEAVRVRDEFLSIASHELKTPLTSLSLKLEVAARAAPPASEGASGAFDLMRRQVKRLANLVDGLLDVSRITSGRLSLVPEENVDLGGLVDEVVARFVPEAERAGCSLNVRVEPGLRGTWDRVRMEQIVSNLLSNAIKYGTGKPIEVGVELAGGRARLSVSDHGIGIAPDAVNRIFAKFERAVSERNYGGMGLGLYITRQIVDAMGGTIAVDSEPGRGARFTVELPLTAA